QGQEGEDVGSQVVGLVEQEQDGEMSFLDEALDLSLEESEGHGAGPEGLEAEGQSEGAAEVSGVDQGVMQVEDTELVGVELVAQSPQGGGLAAAGLAGEQADGAGLDEVAQPRMQLFEHGRPEELVEREGALEGQAGQAESGGVKIHGSSW